MSKRSKRPEDEETKEEAKEDPEMRVRMIQFSAALSLQKIANPVQERGPQSPRPWGPQKADKDMEDDIAILSAAFERMGGISNVFKGNGGKKVKEECAKLDEVFASQHMLSSAAPVANGKFASEVAKAKQRARRSIRKAVKEATSAIQPISEE